MNKIVAVLSVIGSLIAVATFVFDAAGKPIVALSRGARAAIAALLALLAAASWLTVRAEPRLQAAVLPAPAGSVAPGTTIIVESPPPKPGRVQPVAPPPRAKPATRPSAITFDGSADDELTVQVRNVAGGRAFSGMLEQSCTKDDALEGLITCELTLRVRIDDTAFALDSRGGGFTERAAERQARERLAQKIREWGGTR